MLTWHHYHIITLPVQKDFSAPYYSFPYSNIKQQLLSVECSEARKGKRSKPLLFQTLQSSKAEVHLNWQRRDLKLNESLDF